MLTTITDFANERNTDRDTVNAFIRKHPEIKQHVSKDGKNTVIDTDSDGYTALCIKYPLPQMVQIIEDTESRNKLIKAQEVIIQLQTRLNEQSEAIGRMEANQLLLEDRTEQLRESKEAYESVKRELEAERSKTWFQKLRGK